MKKILLYPILCLLAFPMWLSAQGKQIDAGVKAYENGDYALALKELDAGLSEPDGMKDKDLAEGYYYRAEAKIAYVNQLGVESGLSDQVDQMIKEYSFTAYDDLKKASQHDVAKKYMTPIKKGIRKAEKIMLQRAKGAMELSEGKELSEADKKPFLEEAIQFCDALIEVNKRNYVPYTMKGYAWLGLGDETKALKNFHLADDVFFRSAPKKGDLSIANTYMHIATLEWKLNQDMEVALEAIKEGGERLDGESKKIQVLGNLPPADKAAMDRKYQDLKAELAKTEATLRASK